MEGNYLEHALPFLREIDTGRRAQFEAYFRTAPIWLVESFQTVEMPKGSILVQEGEPVHTIYLIGRGIIKATDYRVHGIAYDFVRFNRVYAFGGMETLMNLDEYQTTLQTVTDCTVLKIPQDKYREWLSCDITALWQEANLMGEYLLEEGRNSRAFLFLQGSNRLAMLLTNLYEQEACEGVLRLSADRQELSDLTGLCLKTITRSVKKFAEAELVTKEKGGLQINRAQYERLKEIISEILEDE